jgi:hypothetical protein
MISQIAVQSIFGLPLMLYGGVLTFLSFVFAAYIAWANMRGWARIPMKWHSRMAAISFMLAILHGIFGLSIYMGF